MLLLEMLLRKAPQVLEKKSYQIPLANIKEAQLEAQLDFEEGADKLFG